MTRYDVSYFDQFWECLILARNFTRRDLAEYLIYCVLWKISDATLRLARTGMPYLKMRHGLPLSGPSGEEGMWAVGQRAFPLLMCSCGLVAWRLLIRKWKQEHALFAW